MRTFTKEGLVRELQSIRARGWVVNRRPNNDGGAGNTLEDLLGIEENNLPMPNAGEWEIKCQIRTAALTTMFHCEPSPRAMRFVPNVLLPGYGWRHRDAGGRYSESEKSFRQTINTERYSSRGFCVRYNAEERKVEIAFSHDRIDSEHSEWASGIARNKRETLSPAPYWGMNDLFCVLGAKIHNCFYVLAEKKRERGLNYVRYCDIHMLENLSPDKFQNAVINGHVYVDFDARTGHNHGTKFRIKQRYFPLLFDKTAKI